VSQTLPATIETLSQSSLDYPVQALRWWCEYSTRHGRQRPAGWRNLSPIREPTHPLYGVGRESVTYRNATATSWKVP